jgi:RNA polymerase sporulation-specific sigma factor
MEINMDFEGCSDETLIEIYRVGNEAAIEVLFERYKNLVKKKAKAMYLAGGDSDDLIQEGMIGLYKAVRDFDENREASFKTFASMCINRQLITAVTASNRKKNMPLNTYVSFDLPAYTDEDNEMRLVDVLKPETEQNPEKLLIDREYTEDFKEKLFESLSDFEKQVLKLYIEEKDYREIARIMNKTPKSIDNALQRIRSKAFALEKR